MSIQILPSFLAADLGHLSRDLKRAFSSGADALHLDIMDPTFVPNMSFGPSIVEFCRAEEPSFYRHVHLMMNRPDLYLEKFAAAGAQTIQVHFEADCDLHACLKEIRRLGLRNALAVNPETPVEAFAPYLGEIDEALVMTVHPGFGGQRFISDCLSKVAWLRKKAPALDIMIDGGGNAETCPLAAQAGANLFVAGSYLFRAPDMKEAVGDLRRRVSSAAADVL